MTANDDAPSKPMVLLPSGQLVPAIDLSLKENAHTPEYLLKKMDGNYRAIPESMKAFKRRVCNDRRMNEFWRWIGSVNFREGKDRQRSSDSITDQFYRSTKLPGKPGDMTPKQRESYFAKVRQHTEALVALLKDTRFDLPEMSKLSEDELARPLGDVLWDWGPEDYEDGHVVAFQVTRHAKFQHFFTYPDNWLIKILDNVIEWTYWEDNWDDSLWGSSAPILQANTASVPVVYFCCTMYDWFSDNGVSIPFPILATAANVALELPPENLVDEDTVRKQVRRYQQRQEERRPGNRP